MTKLCSGQVDRVAVDDALATADRRLCGQRSSSANTLVVARCGRPRCRPPAKRDRRAPGCGMSSSGADVDPADSGESMGHASDQRRQAANSWASRALGALRPGVVLHERWAWQEAVVTAPGAAGVLDDRRLLHSQARAHDPLACARGNAPPRDRAGGTRRIFQHFVFGRDPHQKRR